MTALAFRDVACARGGRLLFEGLSFTISAGEALVVTGPNGVGKSSLIRLAAGLLRPAAGTVTRTARRALLTDHSALDGERSVAQALAFWARLDGDAPGGRDWRDALDAVGLAEWAGVPVRLLSTGQRRRVAFARVLMTSAPLWLLDEPANGLDHASVARLEALIANHRADGGCAFIATHLPLNVPDSACIELKSDRMRLPNPFVSSEVETPLGAEREASAHLGSGSRLRSNRTEEGPRRP